jgi:Flp pilus assembly protein TadG
MKSERGQSVVEFALVLPLLIVMLFAIVDISRVFHASLTLDHAGREAARAASVHQEADEVRQTAVENASSISLAPASVSINPPSDRVTGDNVEVTIKYNVSFLTPLIENITGPIELSNTTVMRIE